MWKHWTTDYATEWVCVDCHLSIAGYSSDETGRTMPTPFESDPSVTDAVNGSAPADCDACKADGVTFDDDGAWYEIHADHDHDSFSLSPCRGCGSTLAGDRYAVTITIQAPQDES